MRDELLLRVERLERMMLIPVHEWVNVLDSVPPENVPVLLTGWQPVDHMDVCYVGHRDGNNYYRITHRGEQALRPTHWMHIPRRAGGE